MKDKEKNNKEEIEEKENYSNFSLKLFKLFEKAKEKNISILLVGKAGIGKSSLIYQYAEYLSKKLGKKTIIWHELEEKEIEKIKNNKDKYFVLVDLKAVFLNLEDFYVLVRDNGNVKFVYSELLNILNSNADGILFIDEISNANEMIQNLLFELILQKKVMTKKISDNIQIISAMNDIGDSSSANILSKALLNRFLIIDFNRDLKLFEELKKSFFEYAYKNFDYRVIAFLETFKDEVFDWDNNDENKQISTFRSYELLSKMIEKEEDFELISISSRGLLSEKVYSKFINFIKKFEKLKDWKNYLKKENYLKLNEEEKFAFISILAENYKENFDEIVKFISEIYFEDKDKIIILLKMIRSKNKEHFDKIVDSTKKEIIKDIKEIILM